MDEDNIIELIKETGASNRNIDLSLGQLAFESRYAGGAEVSFDDFANKVSSGMNETPEYRKKYFLGTRRSARRAQREENRLYQEQLDKKARNAERRKREQEKLLILGRDPLNEEKEKR